jgi:hypothetical protein
MNDLLACQGVLQQALLADPLHRLLYLTVLLDPCWDVDWDTGDDWDDPLQLALPMVRACFPEVYVEAVQALHTGISFHALQKLLCAGISQTGIYLENLEWLAGGIPLPSYGSRLYDADFYAEFPAVKGVLKCFGVDMANHDLPADAENLATILVYKLHQCSDSTTQHLGWLVAWVWGVSGNSCIDMDEESLAEYDPLVWSPENVAFAQELIAEAHEIWAEAMAGLDHIHTHPQVLHGLEQIVHTVRQHYNHIYPQGGYISHEQLCQLAQHINMDGATLARSLA